MPKIVAAASSAALLLAAHAAGAQESAVINASAVSRESGEAAAALAESGVKTAIGVSAVPVGSIAVGASVAGSGLVAVAGVSGDAAAESSAVANAPLTVDDEVIVAPQAAPNVPYDAPAGAAPAGGKTRGQP